VPCRLAGFEHLEAEPARRPAYAAQHPVPLVTDMVAGCGPGRVIDTAEPPSRERDVARPDLQPAGLQRVVRAPCWATRMSQRWGSGDRIQGGIGRGGSSRPPATVTAAARGRACSPMNLPVGRAGLGRRSREPHGRNKSVGRVARKSERQGRGPLGLQAHGDSEHRRHGHADVARRGVGTSLPSNQRPVEGRQPVGDAGCRRQVRKPACWIRSLG